MNRMRRQLVFVFLLLFCGWSFSGCASAISDSRDPAMSAVYAPADPDAPDVHAPADPAASDVHAPADPAAPDSLDPSNSRPPDASAVPDWDSMKLSGHMLPDYAAQFSADYYDDYVLITISGEDRYLLIPAGKKCPVNLDSDITPISSHSRIYLAASSAMDYFRALGSLDKVRMTSTQAENWSLAEVVQALDEKSMIYAGKYSAPDYELLLSEGIDLAVESTMIYHTPETKEKIEKLGIPVLVDKSSYERHPLGKMEWIRLYGLLLGIPDAADTFCREQIKTLKEIPELSAMLSSDNSDGKSEAPPHPSEADSMIRASSQGDHADTGSQASTPPTVAYFYITSSGSANIRKPGDYISRMIELSGGTYVFSDLKDSGTSAQATMSIQMEAFLDKAMDADILIYSTSIDGEVQSLDDLYAKAALLRESRAAENDSVWYSGNNMYQQTTAIAEIMLEMHAVIAGNTDDSQMKFLHKLQ